MPFGPQNAYQEWVFSAGMPLSADVGISGASLWRCGEVIASALMPPLCTIGNSTTIASEKSCRGRPPRR